ncbi:hypothetical protein BH24CHL4_BH24CHL4_16810 [soil metagenome]
MSRPDIPVHPRNFHLSIYGSRVGAPLQRHVRTDLSRQRPHQIRPALREALGGGEVNLDQGRAAIDDLLRDELADDWAELKAATALEHDLTLVTRNVVDYRDIPRLSIAGPTGI